MYDKYKFLKENIFAEQKKSVETRYLEHIAIELICCYITICISAVFWNWFNQTSLSGIVHHVIQSFTSGFHILKTGLLAYPKAKSSIP